jgi:hypothetical protein
MAARQPEFITQALAELRKRRPCRSCGRPFRPERIDALTCSETCRWRRSHGQPSYIDNLNTEVAVHQARQFHARIESLLKEVQAYTAAERKRRRERRAAEDIGRDWRAVLFAKIFQAWRKEVVRALNDVLSDRRSLTPDQLQAALAERLPHIPLEAIAAILKELTAE